jgi:hypothetical protein
MVEPQQGVIELGVLILAGALSALAARTRQPKPNIVKGVYRVFTYDRAAAGLM